MSSMLRLLKTVYHKAFTPANCRLEESDSSFFEGFTALAWRQENKRLRAATESVKDTDKPAPMENQFGKLPKLYKLSKKEYELLYIEVLYTVKHKIGVTCDSHSPFQQDLFQYAKEAFSICPEDHAILLARATEEKPPIVVLNVAVIEAVGLEAKDADVSRTFLSQSARKSEAVLLGDFNARVGADNDSWPFCLGSFGVGKMNENGQRLLEFSFNGLCVDDVTPRREELPFHSYGIRRV